jgi:hypothetical protein
MVLEIALGVLLAYVIAIVVALFWRVLLGGAFVVTVIYAVLVVKVHLDDQKSARTNNPVEVWERVP